MPVWVRLSFLGTTGTPRAHNNEWNGIFDRAGQEYPQINVMCDTFRSKIALFLHHRFSGNSFPSSYEQGPEQYALGASESRGLAVVRRTIRGK